MSFGGRLEGLLWIARRARNMSAPELVHRVRERVRRSRMDPEAPAPFMLAERPSFDVAGLRALYPIDSETLGEVEGTVRSGEVRLLGQPLTLARPGWFSDPDGQTWPDGPWTRIGYRNTGRDPKYTWEVHRLLYLLPLVALGPRCQAPDEAGRLVRDLLVDWARSTRSNHGVGWTSGIEVSLRMLALTVLSAADDLELPEDTRTRMREECSQGLHHLESFPSLFSSANNHRVAELVALLLVGGAWGRPAPIAVERELASVADSLFAPDGAPLEQSPTYGAFTLELLGLALRFTEWRDASARDEVQDVVGRSSAFTAELVEPGWGLLRYGDDDEGRVLGVGLGEESWLACLSALFAHPLKPSGPGLQVFEDGGLSVVRTSDGAVLTFDHGPLGFGAIAAHGHLDQLHVSLVHDGVGWIRDPGTFVYHGSPEWRDHFRVAEQHNGPRVEGDDVCDPTGPFNWSRRRPRTVLVESTTTAAGVHLVGTSRSGTHPDHVTRREVDVEAGSLRLRDTGPEDAAIVSRFLVDPGCVVRTVDSGTVSLTHPRSTATVQVHVVSGGLDLDREGGWVSHEYAEKQRAAALTVRSTAAGEPLEVVIDWRQPPDEGA